MSLFSQLRQLYRPDRFQLEDFHTEIVAQVLQNSPALTLAWLTSIGVTTLPKTDHIKVRTQESFHPLANHSTSSRPDITIRLFSGATRELIFVESKQGSTQGLDQLQRYADHLYAAQQSEGLKKVSLVFITRDYEAAETPRQFQFTFQRTRWFQFYQYLKAHVNGDGLAKELKLFMEENRMSLGNQFRSTDLVALENFLSAKALMDETLHGEVSDLARRLLGRISWSKNVNKLQEHHRYIIGNPGKHFQCLIGYWFPYQNPDKPVWVGIKLYGYRWAKERQDVIDAFAAWLREADGTWSADNLNDEWSCLSKGKAIQALMNETDHVSTIKSHFLGLLKEVEAFQRANPKLPWGTTDTDAADELQDSG